MMFKCVFASDVLISYKIKSEFSLNNYHFSLHIFILFDSFTVNLNESRVFKILYLQKKNTSLK